MKAQVHLVATTENRKDNTIYLSPFNQLIHSHTSALDYVPQHLYFTTDEEAKDTDWVLPNAPWDNGPWKYKKAPCPLPYWGGNKDSYRKIVATTNPEGSKSLREINIAKIDTPFIEAYIKAYNEDNPIKEVLLETKSIFKLDEEFELDNLDWALFITQQTLENEHGAQFPFTDLSDEELKIAPKNIELKLKPNGSVIIHPVKERMYTREEVKDILKQFDCSEIGRFSGPTARKEWFDKNYPE